MKKLNYFEKIIQPFESAPNQTPPTSLWGFYAFYLKQVKGPLIALFIVGFFTAILEIVLFKYIGEIVDIIQAVKNPAELFEKHASTFIWMMAVIVLIRPAVSLIHDVLMNQVLTTNFTSLIRWQQHNHLIKQSLNFFHSNFSGGIASRVMSTGQSIRNSVLMLTDSMWRVTIYAVTTVVLFVELNIWLALPMIAWIVAYILLLRYFLPKTRERSHQSAKARSRLMGHIVDSYSNILTLKLFAHSDRESAKTHEHMRHQTDMALYSTRLVTALDFSLTVLNSLLIACTIIVSLLLWQNALITAGAIAFTLSLVIRINTMSTWVMKVVNAIFEDIGSVQDGIKIMTAKHDITDHPNAHTLSVTKGAIAFDHIHFSYHADKPIYQDLSLTIAAGEKVALVGPSGGGKTTLVNLLLRLYEVQQGQITIDGQPIETVTQESLRSNIGVVAQDTALFHCSIRDNILYGNPNATDDRIKAVLTQTKALEFVQDLVDQYGNKGLDAIVGENGVKLSGGQRQRIAIARVLLKNAPILVLDEATSALDSESEAVIQEHLEALMAGKTVIAIAHRLSTIAKMDRLVVIDGGKVIETGTHDDLVAQNGLYATLWQYQQNQ
ncbi:multidrug ABC transporter ATP-binding protein [Wohlfahrtiimonas chitiniclastica]|uniref:ABC transporter ATP-binding protein n=1 Tax=Wohlfahrtiimonas chitiniclastica TaxID=400946 RepID=UPI000B99BF04|nr:ABC transporter ATP-binding protein [Wohlfahrtiimonas chitiniclastica]OYQ77645.1 multidrug ABC transporter ATP-binding protein [Wohlfahrtiimonas chitiniclastica]